MLILRLGRTAKIPIVDWNGRKNMKNKAKIRYIASFLMLTAFLLVLIFWNINSGSVSMTVREVFQILFQKGGDETARNIVWSIRLPRILAALILGGALSVSGFLLQTFFNNPIAGSVCAWYFFRCKTDRSSDDDLPSWERNDSRFRSDDCICICGFPDLNGICAACLA